MLNMFFCRYKQGRKLSWGLHWIFPVVSHLCQNHSLKLCSVAWQCCRLAWLDLIPSLSPQTWLETVRNSCLGLSSNTSSGFIFINIETQAETLVSGLAALSYSLTRPRSPPLLSISKRWENVPTSWKKNKKTMVSRLQMLEWSVELWSDIVALVDSLPFFSSTSITKNMDGMSQHLVKNVQRFHAHKCLNAVS